MKEKDIKTKNKSKKSIIGNIIFWVVLAIVAVYSVYRFTSPNEDVVSIFGRSAVSVLTPSMEDTFYKGDVIYLDTDFDVTEIVAGEEDGDVITYYAMIDVDGDGEEERVLNSHRVVDIVVAPANGELYFETKGDNNDTSDSELIYQDRVVAVWTGQSTRHLGTIINFLQSSVGFLIFIVIPCFAFLVYEIVRFVNVMTEYKTEQALAGRAKLQEEAIAIAKKQLEAEAKLKEQGEKKELEDKE